YNNDGLLDVFMGGGVGGESALWLNRGDSTFARASRTPSASQTMWANGVSEATFADFDNDGWLDLIVAGKSSVFLFRNDGKGKFADQSSLIPPTVRARGASSIAISDVDEDGDEDLWLVDGSGAPRLLRNEGGNSNLAVNVELKGLRN